MRQELALSPAEWLAAGPVCIDDPAPILSAFQPGTAKVVRFTGPHTFYRAAGWNAKDNAMANAYGSWWVDAAVLATIGTQIDKFEDWLPDELLRRAWPAQYKAALALCEDFNDMGEMFRLELPHTDELTGLAGIAAAQPQKSFLDASARSTPLLRGGAEQVCFKKTPTLNSINPLWVFRARPW